MHPSLAVIPCVCTDTPKLSYPARYLTQNCTREDRESHAEHQPGVARIPYELILAAILPKDNNEALTKTHICYPSFLPRSEDVAKLVPLGVDDARDAVPNPEDDHEVVEEEDLILERLDLRDVHGT